MTTSIPSSCSVSREFEWDDADSLHRESPAMRFTSTDIYHWHMLIPFLLILSYAHTDMTKLKQSLHGGHALLEMPTGTGKTVSLLALVLSWQYAHPGSGKFVYSTRTVQEIDKVMEELRRVIAYRVKVTNEAIASEVAKGNLQHGIRSPEILGVCLSSRRNLCIHPTVSKHDNRGKVDALCRNKTASFVREQKAAGHDVEVCSYYEGYDKEGREANITGIYTLSDLKALGQEKGWCPYFTARRLISMANVVVFNYQYTLDPKIASMISKDISKESIIGESIKLTLIVNLLFLAPSNVI